MRLQRLRLRDFRGFEELTLDLDRDLTVLIGTNGSGKSSVVRALDLLASHTAAHAFNREGAELRFVDADVREGAQRCELELVVDGRAAIVQYEPGARGTSWQSELGTSGVPPLVVCLDAARAQFFPPEATRTGGRGVVTSRRPAWDEAFAQGRTAFEWGEWWFREREDLENQERVRTQRLDYSDAGLRAARAAVEVMLPGYSDLHIDRARPNGGAGSQLVLTKAGQELPAHLLSDGERSMLLLALTTARRLSLLSPSESAEIGAATVVIDEVELHLHPRWQREVMPRLTTAFPACQFIVTTHSPQVIASVDASSLVVLDRFRALPSPAPSEGRDTNAILEEIFGTAERPAKARESLRAVEELVDGGDLDAARLQVEELAAQWGDDDREVLRLRTAIKFRDLDAVDP